MKVFHKAPFLSPMAEATVATIGNFDGMHLGHQALLAALKAQAIKNHCAASVILFEPQPREFFGVRAQRLMPLRDKLHYLAQAGIDQVYCLGFNAALAALSAETFIEQLLIAQWHVKHLWVGDDFCFGAGRSGNMALLKQYTGAFDLTQLTAQRVDNIRVSSSLIRQALMKGELDRVTALLGRPFSVSAKVIHGAKRGRTLAFPTLNMRLHPYALAFTGVYAVSVTGVAGHALLLGVANFGTRPTVGGKQLLLETHVFNFNQEVYGQRLQIHFHHKLRAEMKFVSLIELQSQIARDCQQAQAYFEHGPSRVNLFHC